MKKKELAVFTTSDFEKSEDFVIVHDVETNAIIYRNPAMVEMLSGGRPLFSTSVLDLTAERAIFEGREVVIELSKRLKRTNLGVNEAAHQDLTTKMTFAVKNLTKNDFINIDPKTGFANYQKVLSSMIRLIGNYYESPVAQLLVMKSHVNHPFFIHLPLTGKDKAYSKEVVIQDYWWSGFEAYFGHGYALLSQDMEGFKAFDEHLYKAILANGVHSILMIPIIVEGDLVGVVSFGNASNKRDDIFFIGRLLSEQIGTIINRAESFHDLYFDDLTGLPLGEYLEANFTATLHSFGKRPGTLIRLDFLKFRLYNSHYGIQAGDALLKTVAEEIRGLSSAVFIARASHSDVFYVLTPDLPATAQRYCDKLLKIIRGRYPGVNIDMAFGLYQISNHDEPFKIADARASFANKVAKANPLSPICIYDDAMERREAYDLELTGAFNDAIKNNEFELWLQPKYDLEQETYIGGEALVRWRRNGKLIPPGDFIPLFEANGQCQMLDRFMLRKSCETIRRWLDKGIAVVPISVNYSRVDFLDDHLFAETLAIIDSFRVPHEFIEIEITESAFSDNEERMIRFLSDCKKHDIRVLMDDFGSAYSSFNSLKDLDVDVLKLDYKFLSKCNDWRKQHSIIETIVALARSLDTSFIVEGVETADEVYYFRQLGVRYIQGFYYSPPIPVSEFEKLNRRVKLADRTGSSASSHLMEKLLDNRSTTNFVFYNAGVPMGIFQYGFGKLTPLLMNQRLKHSFATLFDTAEYGQINLLDYMRPDSREKTIQCLAKHRESGVFGKKHPVDFHFGLKRRDVLVSSVYLSAKNNISYYLIQFESIVDDDSYRFLKEFSKTDLPASFDTMAEAVMFFGEDEKLIYSNPAARVFYPDAVEGALFEAILGTHARMHMLHRVQRFYDERVHMVMEFKTAQVSVDDDFAYYLEFTRPTSVGNRLLDTTEKGLDFYDRMLDALGWVALFYCDIDIGEDLYREILLDKRTSHTEITREGRFSADLLPSVLERIHPKDREELANFLSLEELLAASHAFNNRRILVRRAEDEKKWLEIDVSFAYHHGHHHALVFVRDGTEMQEKNCDPLTGALTRPVGFGICEKYIEDNKPFTFIIADVDEFKRINDTYGHPTGDKILVSLGKAAKDLPSSCHAFTRLGGDEFCFVIDETRRGIERDAVNKFMADIAARISKEAALGEDFEFSFGMARFPEDAVTFRDLYFAADMELYEDKKRPDKARNKRK